MVRNLYINLAHLRLLEIPKMGVYTYINIGKYTYAYIDIYVGTIEGSPFKKWNQYFFLKNFQPLIKYHVTFSVDLIFIIDEFGVLCFGTIGGNCFNQNVYVIFYTWRL